MPKSILNHFLSLLLSGNIHDIAARYYDNNVKVILNNNIKTKEKVFGIGLLQHALDYMQILQFKVDNVKYKENKLSYEVYLITRNRDNNIDFSEHQIVNQWKDNLICQHDHIIINH